MTTKISDDPTVEEIEAKVVEYTFNPIAFLIECVKIFDAVSGNWIEFQLWREQKKTIRSFMKNRLHVILKARQVGLTWLALGYALWKMIFRPEAVVMVYSRRDDEAIYLVHERLRDMFVKLPEWLRGSLSITQDSAHILELSNGSIARAFPTTAGDSYTATLVIVDEADLLQDLDRVMKAVKPTIDAGGEMILLSRADKKKPNSTFKRIYKEAKAGNNPWKDIFLPWWVRPDRTVEDYEELKREILSRTGSIDELKEQYPATDEEALTPLSRDKRIPAEWIEECYIEMKPLSEDALNAAGAPGVPGLSVYKLPKLGKMIIAGVDPAEGNPNSDESSASFVDETGEEVALLVGLFHPTPFSDYIHQVAEWYSMLDDDGENQNEVFYNVERNNHGHAVIQWLKANSMFRVLLGHDGKEGFLSSTKGKALLYNAISDSFRDGDNLLHSWSVYLQLASIDGNTLRAPEGENDDQADGYSLAIEGMTKAVNRWLI